MFVLGEVFVVLLCVEEGKLRGWVPSLFLVFRVTKASSMSAVSAEVSLITNLVME